MQDPRGARGQAAQGAILSRSRDLDFEAKIAEVLCIYRDVELLKQSREQAGEAPAVASSPMTRSWGCRRWRREAALPDWSLAPVVRALQALRGMALVTAATLVAELGDITRFANPCQLMAYLGLIPSEHSSGATRRQGGITKAGNGAARAAGVIGSRHTSAESNCCDEFWLSDSIATDSYRY